MQQWKKSARVCKETNSYLSGSVRFLSPNKVALNSQQKVLVDLQHPYLPSFSLPLPSWLGPGSWKTSGKCMFKLA